MRPLFRPLALAVAAETAATLTPVLEAVTEQLTAVDKRLKDLDDVRASLDRLVHAVERIEAARPGWLATQRLPDLDQHWTAYAQPLNNPHAQNGRNL